MNIIINFVKIVQNIHFGALKKLNLEKKTAAVNFLEYKLNIFANNCHLVPLRNFFLKMMLRYTFLGLNALFFFYIFHHVPIFRIA